MAQRSPGAAALAAAALVLAVSAPAQAGYVTFGSGFGSKWDDPVHGNPATITWGFVTDGTTVDPAFFIADEVQGGSDVTRLRADYDASYGAGAFDAALQRAFDTWELVAGVTFVGPVADGGGAIGATGATTPDLRIGAFEPVPGTGFEFVGAVGFGPPGDDLHFPDALAGDVMFNLGSLFIQPAGAEGAPIVELGNDLENLFLHELGHAAMGLGHPAEGVGEVMYVGFDCCDAVNRDPSPDDIAGAEVVYGPSATPACQNGIDDDGDGLTDAPADTGCASAADPSERGTTFCDNGFDDDGDGYFDFPEDPGCRNAAASERTQCQDGLDNDGRTGIDFDGGASLNGGVPIAVKDPQCNTAWRGSEAASACGLGFELALLAPLLDLGTRRYAASRTSAALSRPARSTDAGGSRRSQINPTAARARRT